MDERKRTTIRMPAELHEAARIHTFKTGTTLTEIVTKLLSAYMETQETEEKRVIVDLPPSVVGKKGNRIILTVGKPKLIK